MTIWLINPYGPIPTEKWREYQFTAFGNYLSSEGHDVIWWTSNFSHHFKKFRSNGWEDVQINEKFKVRLVPSPSYNNNIGIRRIWRDWVFSYKTYKRGKEESLKPDLIIFSENPLCFGYAGEKLANYYKIPAIFNQMDLWPELFENVFPSYLKKFSKLLFTPIYYFRSKTYKNLTAFISLARPYLEIPLKQVPILNSKPHDVIYNGIDVEAFRNMMTDPKTKLISLPNKEQNEVWAIFAGSLGPSYDIPAIIKASEMLEKEKCPIKIIIVGDGPYKSLIEDYIKNKKPKKLYYLGFMPPSNLTVLYKYCDIGISAYTSKSNVEMPDKFYDFTAAGLAIVNSLKGEISVIVKDNNLGLQYEGGNSQDLYEKLKLLSENIDYCKTLAKNAHSIASIFDKKNQLSKLKNILSQI
jgi:glycosyltransferase involved in cell wall biosynthesis